MSEFYEFTVDAAPVPAQAEVHETEQPADWLDMLGLGHLRGKPTGKEKDGEPVLCENFAELCGDHALPVLKMLEKLNPLNPAHAHYFTDTREFVVATLGRSNPALFEDTE